MIRRSQAQLVVARYAAQDSSARTRVQLPRPTLPLRARFALVGAFYHRTILIPAAKTKAL